MEGTLDPPKSALESLPIELLLCIFEDDNLTKDDVKNLRLVARCFHSPANRILFRSIRISRLCKDRDLFVQSCKNVNIAQFVQEVVWDEVGWDQNIFPDLARRLQGRFPPPRPHELTAVQSTQVDIESQDMFWFPVADPQSLFNVSPLDGDVARRRKLAVDGFGPTFQACVDRLTNLHTFTSRPISLERLHESLFPGPGDLIIRRMRGFYIFSISESWAEWRTGPICRSFDLLNERYTTRHQDGQPKIPRNDGLFMFLLPDMARPTSTVRNLNWGDEYPGLSHIRSLPRESLKQLESLNACFLADYDSCRSTLKAGANWDSLIKALCHAANLQHVRLCCHHDHPWVALHSVQKLRVCPIEDSLAGVLRELDGPLRTLHLSGLHPRTANLMNWIEVIRKHTATLREVVIEMEKRACPNHRKPQKRQVWADFEELFEPLPGWRPPDVERNAPRQEHRNCILDRDLTGDSPRTEDYVPVKITARK